MGRRSRLPLDPTTLRPSVHSFGALSNFLRGAIADEESRQFSESMGQLAAQAEAVVLALRASRARAVAAPVLMDLLTVLREHRGLVVSLSPAWRGLYEYAAYLQALNNLRVLIGQWLLGGDAAQAELPMAAEDLELVAWRVLGEGMLLIDMYEQWVSGEQGDEPGSALGRLEEPQVERAVAWWKKLRL